MPVPSPARMPCSVPSTKASDRRAKLPRASYYAKAFEKDWKSLSQSGLYDLNLLKDVMLRLIANSGPRPPERKDHELVGKWSGYRECHIGGNFLLIYKICEATISLAERVPPHCGRFGTFVIGQ